MFGPRILILAPHPDDEVVGCFEAIRQARAQGARVFILFLTTGVPSPACSWPWQRPGHGRRVARRLAEAQRVAEALGVEILDRPRIASRDLKGHLHDGLARIVAALDRTGADRLWVPAYEGGHPDHDLASFLAGLLRQRLPVWEFAAYNFAGRRIRSHAFPEPSGRERVLTLDAAAAAAKRAALATYASERGNLGYVALEREVFRPQVAADYRRPPHAGRLFYQRFQWVPLYPRINRVQPEEVVAAVTGSGLARAAGPADDLWPEREQGCYAPLSETAQRRTVP